MRSSDFESEWNDVTTNGKRMSLRGSEGESKVVRGERHRQVFVML